LLDLVLLLRLLKRGLGLLLRDWKALRFLLSALLQRCVLRLQSRDTRVLFERIARSGRNLPGSYSNVRKRNCAHKLESEEISRLLPRTRAARAIEIADAATTSCSKFPAIVPQAFAVPR